MLKQSPATIHGSCSQTFTLALLTALTVSGCATTSNPANSATDGIAASRNAPTHNDKQQLALTGIRQLAAGELEAASDSFNEGLKQAPQNASLHFLNGLTYHSLAERGDYSYVELAEVGYQVSQRFDDKNWWTYYFSGVLSLKNKDYAGAREFFVQALLLDRDNYSATRGMAIASYFLGDMNATLAATQQMLKARPLDARTLQLAALASAAAGRFNESEQFYTQLTTVAGNQDQPAWVQRRVDDWRAVYLTSAADGPAVANPGGDSSSSSAGTSDSAPTKAYSDTAQALIDVVIIRSDEQSGTRKGINLLDGLNFTFSQITRLTSKSIDAKSADVLERTNSLDPALVFPRTSSRVLAIPSVNYSLNIFNTIEDQNHVIARPSLTAMEGKASTFFSGVELTIGLAGNFSAGTLEHTQIGVTLMVTPEQITENDVLLEVSAERDSLEPAPLNSFQQVVQTTKNEVSASARVEYDKTLVLSGITVEETSNLQNKTPGLGDIPLFEWLFNVRQNSNTRSSVIFLLTPRRVGAFEGLPGQANDNQPERSKNLADLLQRWGHSDASDPNLNYILKGVQNEWILQHIRSSDVSMQGIVDEAEVKEVLDELTRQLHESRVVI